MPRLLDTGDIVIVPPGEAPKTGPDDPVDFYYRRLSGGLYRARLRLAARLLGPGPVGSLLEVGYGSGIFLPELARRARRLTGLEVHDQAPRVAEMLKRYGVEAKLTTGSVLSMPFEDGVFDAVVSLSVLEHLSELGEALTEIRRVLVPGGVAVLGFPVRNPITDACFRLVGYDPRELHPSGHAEILAAVRRHDGLQLERQGHVPWFLPLRLSAYAACRCVARQV